MAEEFFWSESDEPHALRRRQMLAAYPEIKELFGPDPSGFFKISGVVLLQICAAALVRDLGWPFIVLLAYFFGAFLNHNLFLAIHELSHNLVFATPLLNKILGIFANLPVGIPMSITFQKYHLDHHNYQGIQGLDVDIPSYSEGRIVRNTASKIVWVFFQLFFYALRPLFVNPKPPGLWEALNLSAQLLFDAALVYFAGYKPLAFLILSTFLGGGLHPMAGHFISEHYVFQKGQETYSYYGPLNLLTWNVGYHNEHHDFPRIPGSKLYKLKQIAPEFYEGLASHSSWIEVIYRYITDPTIGPFCRTIRRPENNMLCRRLNEMGIKKSS
ncbi:hypothetical protein SELMODRAFT_77748 [Selaginella moellendorffii]|uniref:Sphingolipid delta(4)-desaturase DES1-like n=1 Tax=Selaginella moellendorffii TaxID=88036 RepID=D8QRG3_SELML|nr:sphingolipid delta(4)-desaturase DES1-like [Selaginella moellendorffii]EFJ36772.1 hypothetical protein SELMODRAFT_77748 [Selaginella moellendorffii]|eukprot:XP_002961512.1 sphingolipid delta(4)-desaturase DES1-like [Selaginella moellendorffii]